MSGVLSRGLTKRTTCWRTSLARNLFKRTITQSALYSARSGPYSFSNVSHSYQLSDYENFSISGNKEQRRQLLQKVVSERPAFHGNIYFIGSGAVALCCLDLFERMVQAPWNKVTIVDMLDVRQNVQQYLDKGARFIQQALDEENFKSVFEKLIKPGDMIIDLTVDSGSLDFMQWCSKNRVFYINSSVEAWHSSDPETFDPVKDCQFHEFDATDVWKDNSRRLNPELDTTIVYGLGANPGLVNLFCKQNLEDLAKYTLFKNDPNTVLAQNLQNYLSAQQFNKLSQQLGVKVIHISEIDTQITNPQDDRKPGEAVNTWSIDGMYYECVFLNSEVAWGTHEKSLPKGALRTYSRASGQPSDNPSHILLLPVKGKDSSIRSWTPGGEFVAFAITHEENYEIVKDLTVKENGELIYRPTCNFAYRPSDACIETLAEVSRTAGKKLPPVKRILSSEITKGNDILGVLTMGHLYNAWWTGSLLGIEETRELVGPRHNSTTLQVAVGVMAGVSWMIRNPKAGIMCASDLPHQEVLPSALPFLGPFVSIPVSWRPPLSRHDANEWQFDQFAIYNKLGLNLTDI